MGVGIAVHDQEVLIHIQRKHVRNILATFLIEFRFVRGYLAGGGSAQTFGKVDHNVLQTSVGSNDDSFRRDGVGLVQFLAIWFFRHVYRFLVWCGAVKFYGPCDFALGCRTDIARGIQNG